VNLLAVDAAGETLSVALRAGGRVLTASRKGKHDETLLPAAESLLRRASVSWKDLDAVAAATGPGRFTGIRIGLSFAAAAGFQLGVPALGVSRLEALALRSDGERVLAALPGWKGEVYHQEFCRYRGRFLRAAGEPAIAPAERWEAERAAAERRGLTVAHAEADARDLLAAAEALLAAKRKAPLEPFYLKPAGYERPAR